MTFLRWLVELTGEGDKIRQETTKQIGQSMHDYSYWFTGGLQYGNNHKYDITNALEKYSEILRKGRTHLFGSEHNNLRDELYRLSEKNECVHK